jgi:hypothetical protein
MFSRPVVSTRPQGSGRIPAKGVNRLMVTDCSASKGVAAPLPAPIVRPTGTSACYVSFAAFNGADSWWTMYTNVKRIAKQPPPLVMKLAPSRGLAGALAIPRWGCDADVRVGWATGRPLGLDAGLGLHPNSC